jgi:hypothetical protein
MRARVTKVEVRVEQHRVFLCSVCVLNACVYRAHSRRAQYFTCAHSHRRRVINQTGSAAAARLNKLKAIHPQIVSAGKFHTHCTPHAALSLLTPKHRAIDSQGAAGHFGLNSPNINFAETDSIVVQVATPADDESSAARCNE